MTWADVVLRLLLSRRDRDTVSGDLLEAYREDILPSRGLLGARLWYWRQVCGFVSPAVLGLMMGTSLGVLNLIATARNPLADDDGGEMLVFVALVLLAWTAAGFVAARRTRRLVDGVRSGVLVGLAMMAVFHVAAIVRVNLFLDVIRDRGDWQNLLARFGQSGFHSLRAYANYEYVRDTPIIVGIGAAAGAIAGALGGTAALSAQGRQRSSSLV
jgi:hypothetical protein